MGTGRPALRLILTRFKAIDESEGPHLVMLGSPTDLVEPCNWLECEFDPEGHRVARLRGAEGLPLAAPHLAYNSLLVYE